MPRILFLFLLTIFPCALFAGEGFPNEATQKLRVISVNDGLPQQAVICMAQDTAGFLWLGTYDGLCRYDGYRMSIYRHIPSVGNSLTGNRILSLLEDPEGNLWVGTAGYPALNLYDPSSDSFIKPRYQPWNECNSIACDREHRLWIGSSNGAFTFDASTVETGRVPERVVLPGLTTRNIKNIVSDPQGSIWILADKKLFKMRSPSEIERMWNDPLLEEAASIYCDPHSNLFALCSSGLYVLERGTLDFVPTGLSVRPTSILETNPGSYIVGLEKSRIILLERTSQGKYSSLSPAFGSDPFFEVNIIRLFFMDRAGILYIGSGSNGVAVLDPKAELFRKFDIPNHKQRNFIRMAMKDSRGRLWLGIKQGGLYLLDGGRWRDLGIDPQQNINAIHEDTDGSIWICTSKNVYIYRYGRLLALRDIKGLPIDLDKDLVAACAIAQDRNGALWIAGTGKMVRLQKPFGPKPQYKLFDAPFSINVYCMLCDTAKNRLWIGSSSRGLFLVDLDPGSEPLGSRQFSFSNARIKSNQVWCLHTDRKDGRLWIGSDSGVSTISIEHGDTIVTDIDASPRLATSKIMAITEDTDGCLWLNSSQGLLRYDPATNYYREYYHSDGLCSNTTTEAAFSDHDGTIYVGTIDGMNYFDPHAIRDDDYIAPPVIVGLSINNHPVTPSRRSDDFVLDKDISLTDAITISHRSNNFTFEFLSPGFRNPQRTIYAYMLAGWETHWNYTDGAHRTASYNRLPARHYTFRVKAANADGVWSDRVREVEITVRPAPWNTWWAWSSYVLILIGVGYIIFHYYHLQYKYRKDAQIEQIQRQHERILYDTRLRFHTNISHEIRTLLTLICAPLDQVMAAPLEGEAGRKLEIVKNNVDHLDQLVQQFLDLRRIDSDAMPLQLSPIDLTKLVESVCARFTGIAQQKKVSLHVVCQPSSIMEMLDGDKIIKILSNLLSNALKFTSETGSVTVFTERGEQGVELSVEDTGCGIPEEEQGRIFDRFYQGSEGQDMGMGIGLSLVKRLVELHEGRISVFSRPGQGSLFTVWIPCDEELVLPAAGSDLSKSEPLSPDKPMLMIVEDNPDMIAYLKMNLEEKYNIICESRLEPAMELALRHIPDMVLLDVMLDNQNGLELCRDLKGNILTSHIPVLILSAADSQQEIEAGYANGAEDYILKPFKTNLLIAKIGNILSYRRERAVSQRNGASRDMSEQDPFIERLQEIIRNHMQEPEFGTTVICRQMGTSRTQLYRKLSVITDKTVSDMIRNQRMERAIELLRTGRYNVTEAMYHVGISSNSYFTRTFRDYFGINPSDVIRGLDTKAHDKGGYTV